MEIVILGVISVGFIGTISISLMVLDEINRLEAELKKYNRTRNYSYYHKTKKRSYRRSKQITSKFKIVR